MFNGHVSIEDAKERMQEHMKEAENYKLHKQLGFTDNGIGRWVLVLIVVVTIVVVVL